MYGVVDVIGLFSRQLPHTGEQRFGPAMAWLLEVNKYSAHIYFRLFSDQLFSDGLFRTSYFRTGYIWPKFCFARLSVTVHTVRSNAGRKCNAAEMCFSPGRPKFEWAEHLYTYSKWTDCAGLDGWVFGWFSSSQ